MTDPRPFLDRMSGGYQDAMILLAANHLGVFGALATGPRTAAELASQLEVDPRALDILLRALVGAEVLVQPSPDGFAMRDDLAPYLDPASADTMHSILDHHHHLLARWVQLADVVRTGEPAPAAGPRSDRSLRAFICGMKDISRRSSEEVADVLPELGGCGRLLDLGGGPGTSALTFCRRWPQLAAVVFDLPEVVAIAEEEIEAAGLSARVSTLAGDYHVDPLAAPGAAPYGAVYVSNIIHSLSPDETGALLRKAVDVLAPGGLLVIKDFYLDDTRTRPAFGSRFAVNMLVGTAGGKSYTWRETADLCRGLGLGDVRRLEVAVNSGLVVARQREP
ncbi:MAG: methyltransferase [Candidatus Krumholzibacteriia bacterium]